MAVYFILNRERGAVKIGFSTAPFTRLSAIRSENVDKIELLGIIKGDGNESDRNLRIKEKELHCKFRKYRIKGEWFIFSEEIKKFVQENTFLPKRIKLF